MTVALTDRQQRVCDLVAQGFSNKQIGETLGISRRTVEEHRKAVFKKLEVHNAVELVRKTLGATE
jgi:DNA-binding NarL/FixJ family response regulator